MRLTDMARAWITRLFPRAKDRRALVAGGFVMGLIVVLGRGVPAWREWDADAGRTVEESRRVLALARAEVRAEQSNARSRGQLMKQLDSLSGTYLHAPGAAVAGATLASLVTDLAGESGIRVTSASVRPDSSTRSAFTRIAVRISATGDVEGLSDYLSSIESYGQLLAVRELSIAQAEPAAPDSRPEALHFDILVEGLVRIDTVAHANIARRSTALPQSSVKE